MINFRVWLKETNKPRKSRLKFDLEKFKDPAISEEFQAVLEGKFALLHLLEEDLKVITKNFTDKLTKATNEAVRKNWYRTKPGVTNKILDMCDTQRNLKKNRNTTQEKAKEKKDQQED